MGAEPRGLPLETDRLVLALPRPDAARKVVAYYDANRAHFARWDPRRPPNFYDPAYWEERLAQNVVEGATDVSLRLFIFRRGERDGPIVGTANLSNFVRGMFQACHLGYGIDHREEGKGLMAEALRAVIVHAFGPLGFHRIMANHMPANERSAFLLRRLGFAVEGYARDYLFLDGAWRDHVLTALVNPRNAPPS